MNADIFAEWLRRQNYRVERTPSSYWFEASPRVYQAFPYHWTVEPHEEELTDLLRRRRAVALRYSAPVTAPRGKISYHVICQGEYELGGLSRQVRQAIRKGLAYVEVEPISLARLAQEGWPLRADTLARQGRIGAESRAWWQRLCDAAVDLPGFEAWGALHDGELVASFLGVTCDDCYLLPYEQSATAHLSQRINNAIFFAVTDAVLKRPEIAQVFFCLQSLDAPCSVDEFKFRMGYTARPVRQRVLFHPWLAPLASMDLCDAAVRRLVTRHPDNASLGKAAGMLQFYREGKLASDEQEWPDGLADRRNELLASL